MQCVGEGFAISYVLDELNKTSIHGKVRQGWANRQPVCVGGAYTSDAHPPHPFEVKVIAPCGPMPIRYLTVLWCL